MALRSLQLNDASCSLVDEHSCRLKTPLSIPSHHHVTSLTRELLFSLQRRVEELLSDPIFEAMK